MLVCVSHTVFLVRFPPVCVVLSLLSSFVGPNLHVENPISHLCLLSHDRDPDARLGARHTGSSWGR